MNKKERDKLILKYAPLVKSIVDRIACKVPAHVAERDDLINVGVIGLISALEKFDKGRNVQFETYARFRIRGAVLDELRARDWQPRSARNKDARIEKAMLALQRQLGRPPDEVEVAEYMELPLEDYYQLLDEGLPGSRWPLSARTLPPDYCEKYATITKVLEKMDQASPQSRSWPAGEVKYILKTVIEALTTKEKTGFSLSVLYEELKMKKSVSCIKLPRSRLQLHSQARAWSSGLGLREMLVGGGSHGTRRVVLDLTEEKRRGCGSPEARNCANIDFDSGHQATRGTCVAALRSPLDSDVSAARLRSEEGTLQWKSSELEDSSRGSTRNAIALPLRESVGSFCFSAHQENGADIRREEDPRTLPQPRLS